jgi:hypothetical protein
MELSRSDVLLILMTTMHGTYCEPCLDWPPSSQLGRQGLEQMSEAAPMGWDVTDESSQRHVS